MCRGSARIVSLLLAAAVFFGAQALSAADSFGNIDQAANSSQNGWTWICKHPAPASGEIHSVTTRVATVATGTPQVVFKHLRNTGGNNFQLVDQSPTYTLEVGVQNYPVNFVNVQAGDFIGYYVSSTSNAYRYVYGDYCYSYSGLHSSGTVTYTYRSNWRVPLLATLYAEGIGELFGDATLATTGYQGRTFIDEHQVPSDGTIVAASANFSLRAGYGQAYVQFKHYRNTTGNQFTVVQESANFYATVGLATYPLNFTGVLQGDYIGYYVSGSVYDYRWPASGHSCWWATGNHHSGTTTYTQQSGWMVPITGVVYASGALENFGDSTTSCNVSLNNTTLVSRYTAPSSGQVTGFSLNLNVGGPTSQLIFKQFRNTGGNNFQLIQQSQTFEGTAGRTIYSVNFPNVQAGDYFGYYTSGCSSYRSWGGEYCWSTSGNHTTGTLTYTYRSGWLAPLGILLANDGAVSAAVTLDGGYNEIPQGSSLGSTVTKTGGPDFVSGVTLVVDGGSYAGLSGTVGTVNNADSIEIDWTADRDAAAGSHTFQIKNGTLLIASGTVNVAYPQQLISNRQGGSAQEPPMNGAFVANSVNARSGEFVHRLPLLSIPGRMLPLGVGLSYRSRLDTLGSVGAGWTASFDNQLTYSSGADQITLRSGDGRIDVFALQSGGTAGVGPYILPGFFLQLWRNDNGTGGTDADDTFTIKYAHGSQATFTAVNLDIASQQVFRQTQFRDRYGNAVTYEYNGVGQLQRMLGDMYNAGISKTRYALVFSYNAHGRLYKITDYADYTGQQSVIGSSYTGNREWEFVYNSSAQLVEIKLPKTENYYSETKGSTYRTRVQFTYDSNDNLLEVIDARQANETTPLGWLKNHYDGSDRVDYQDVGRSSSSDTDHRQYIVYTSSTETDVLDAEAHRSKYYLNTNGTASGVRHYTTSWTYASGWTSDGVKAHSTDPAYFETLYQYDTEFHVIQVTHPLGNISKFRYDIGATDQRSRGNLLRVLSHPGSVSTSNLPADQVNGLLASFTYTSAAQFNLLATSVSPRAYVLGSSYDIVNNTGITTNNSSLYTTTNSYYFSHGTYPDGTLEKTVTPTVDGTVFAGTLNANQYLQSTFTYNTHGQVVTSTDQAGVQTTFVYGASGFNQGYLTEVKLGTQVGVTPLVSEFRYNSVGRAITVEDALNYVYTSYLNQLDQVVKSTTPQVSAQMGTGSAATYYTRAEFDLNGNVSKFAVSNIDEYGTTLSPSEIDTTYAYNILDMVTSVTEDIDASTTRTTNFTYDKIFRLIETTLPESNKTGTDYDEINRAIKSYAGYGGGVAKTSALVTSEVFYDANSNVVKAVDGRCNDSHYTYDAYDRLFKAEDRKASQPNWTEYTYNQAGQVTATVRKGHKRYWTGSAYAWSSYGSMLSEAQYEIDNIGRVYLSRAKAQDSAGTNLGYSTLESSSNYEAGWSTSRLQFRVNGQVERIKDDLGYETGYEYDSYNRLLKVVDDRDATTTGPVSTSGGDNYDQYAYDANGNVTSVTAHLFDDRGSGGNKTITTTFAYDELNRLKSDTSPSVTTLERDGTLSTGSLVREFKYDSRSNLVRTFDRDDVERITTYDLLGRPTRGKVSDVIRREIDSSGYLGTSTQNIESRTVYDKNSNVTQSIDPTGNRTYFRYDLAGRWLQTQHADGGSGTALKTTAGSGHTITAVGSTVFYSKSGAYDGNGNLLLITDENDTQIAFTYDENDLLTDEDGTPGSGNPFNLEGEGGMEYLYDGLYRSVYGKTHDGTNTLTEVDSLFNTLGALDQQRQRIARAHPNDTGFARELTTTSKWDESGRRHQRTNPSGITRVSWDFDRKHRPVEELVENYTTSWQTPTTSATFEYLGGGLLHSRQTRYMKDAAAGITSPFVSNFDRDDLLRLTKVRHHRDDSGLFYGDRLVGRFDYTYNKNSMMAYEARWYHDDDDDTSVTPDETDYYFYDSISRLEKAVYGATKYTGFGTTITSSTHDDAYAVFGDDTNNAGTFSDRIYYTYRKSGTRDKVNWYRGAATGSSSALSSRNDSSTAPEQTTNYSTSESGTADPDNPTGDGAGSRHNYTVIGQYGYQYDNLRNVIADATREFRYNYRSQLRRVIRKSDGDDISKYREDAYGRRVMAVVNWELGRRVYFDTRFERDVDMDWDNDSTEMKYVDGGLTSNDTPGPGMVDQISAWPSRLDKALNGNDTHYIDFHVDVPDVSGSSSTYLGFVAYENYEVRIYGNRYELWTTGGGSAIASYTAPGNDSKGRHNIGLAAGLEAGLWIDGTAAMSAGASITQSPEIRFGTHDIGSSTDGLVLLECLTYFKSFELDPEGDPVDPRVSLYFFDGPQPVTEERVKRPTTTPTTYMKLDAVSPTQQDTFDGSDRSPRMMLPNGRRTTCVVIEPGSDAWVNDEGTMTTLPSPMSGVSHTVVTDATGNTRTHGRDSVIGTPTPGPYMATQNFEVGIHLIDMVSIHQGVGGGPEGTFASMITAFASASSASGSTDKQTDLSFNSGDRTCACDGIDVSQNSIAATVDDPATGFKHDMVGGNVRDWPPGIMFGGGGLDSNRGSSLIGTTDVIDSYKSDDDHPSGLVTGRFGGSDAEQREFEAAVKSVFEKFGITVEIDGSGIELKLHQNGHAQLFRMLKELAKSRHQTKIFASTDHPLTKYPSCKASNYDESKTKGKGSGSTIVWNPELGWEVDPDNDARYEKESKESIEKRMKDIQDGKVDASVISPGMTLIHELIHAWHNIQGINGHGNTNGEDFDAENWKDHEEERTITGKQRDKNGKELRSNTDWISEWELADWLKKYKNMDVAKRKGHGEKDSDMTQRVCVDADHNPVYDDKTGVRSSAESKVGSRWVKVSDVWGNKTAGKKPQAK